MLKKVISIGLIIVVALISIFPVTKEATDMGNYTNIIESIEEKEKVVTGVIVGSAVVSTVLAAIPGDATTPVATHVLDLSKYLIIVLVVLVLEKTLLPLLGMVSFTYIVPIGLVLLVLFLITNKKWMKDMAIKLVVFGVVLALIVPLGVGASDLIYQENQETINGAMEEIKNMDVDSEKISIVDGEFKLTKIPEYVENIIESVKNSTQVATDKIEGYVNVFIDATVMLMVTCMIIPIGLVLALIWLTRMLFSLNFDIKVPKIKSKPYKISLFEKKPTELVQK